MSLDCFAALAKPGACHSANRASARNRTAACPSAERRSRRRIAFRGTLSAITGRLAISSGLELEQFGIAPTVAYQFIVGAGLAHPAAVEHDDPVGAADA